MNRNVLLCLAMFMVIVLAACTQSTSTSKSTVPAPSDKWSVELTLANEVKQTTVFIVFADGVEVLRKEIEGTERGYFGQEVSVSTLTLENSAQILEVRTDSGVGAKIKLEPGQGAYVTATLWADGFVIQQAREKQQRFD